MVESSRPGIIENTYIEDKLLDRYGPEYKQFILDLGAVLGEEVK
jgi:hypothetical protein